MNRSLSPVHRRTGRTLLAVATSLLLVLPACGDDDADAAPEPSAEPSEPEAGPAGSESSEAEPTAAEPTAPEPTAVEATAAEPEIDLSGVSITVGIQSSGSSVAKAILDASGALDDTPYDVVWADFDGANAAVEALNAGAIDLDIGLNSSAPVLAQGNSKDPWTAESAPFKIIGATVSENAPGIAVVVHGDSGIESVADLAGKKVSFAKGTANHYFWVLAAVDAGIQPDDVELVLLPLSEARAAFQTGAVDALVTAVGNARPLERSEGAKVVVTSKGRFDNYSFFVARNGVLDDPAVEAATADLLSRLQRANEWEAANPEIVAALYESEAKQSPEDAWLSATEGVGSYVPLDDAVIATQQNQADVFFEQDVAESQVDVSIAFDTRFNHVLGGTP